MTTADLRRRAEDNPDEMVAWRLGDLVPLLDLIEAAVTVTEAPPSEVMLRVQELQFALDAMPAEVAP